MFEIHSLFTNEITKTLPTLPTETLIEIFLLACENNADEHLPVVISHVCSLWRSSALHSQLLWTNICIQLGETSDASMVNSRAMQYFRRSGERLLDISLDFRCKEGLDLDRKLEFFAAQTFRLPRPSRWSNPPPFQTAMFEQFKNRFYRCRSLTIKTDSLFAWTIIGAGLQNLHAPALLDFSFEAPHNAFRPEPQAVFTSGAPLLSSIKITRYRFDNIIFPDFSTLQSFVIRESAPHKDFTGFANFLAPAISLRHLGVPMDFVGRSKILRKRMANLLSLTSLEYTSHLHAKREAAHDFGYGDKVVPFQPGAQFFTPSLRILSVDFHDGDWGDKFINTFPDSGHRPRPNPELVDLRLHNCAFEDTEQARMIAHETPTVEHLHMDGHYATMLKGISTPWESDSWERYTPGTMPWPNLKIITAVRQGATKAELAALKVFCSCRSQVKFVVVDECKEIHMHFWPRSKLSMYG